jgi:hypothetical protein
MIWIAAYVASDTTAAVAIYVDMAVEDALEY